LQEVAEKTIAKAYLVKDKKTIRIYDNLDLFSNIADQLGEAAVLNTTLSCIEFPIEDYNILKELPVVITEELLAFIRARGPDINILKADYWQSFIKGMELRPFQIEFLQWAEIRRQLAYPPKGSQKGVACLFSQGLGKTVTALALDGHLRQVNGWEKTIIICRSNNKYSTWADHLEKQVNLKYTIVDGDRKTRLAAIDEFKEETDVLVIHYEGVRLHYKELVNIPDIVIIDEMQSVANAGAQQSKATATIVAKAKYVLGLSGGVAQNKIAVQLWHPLYLLDNKMWPSYKEWIARWCVTEEIQVPLYRYGKRIMDKNTGRWITRPLRQVSGIRDREQLSRAIAPYLYQKSKEEVAEQLPPKIYQTVLTGLYKRQKELYREVRDNVITKIKGQSVEFAIVQMLRLYQICSTLSCLGMADISAKADEAVEMMLELSPENKALVFAKFVPMANSIYNRLIKNGVTALLLTGETNKADREVIRQQFRKDPSFQFLVTTIALEGTGSDYAVASYMYRTERDYRPLVNEQADDRIHRLTSTKTVNIIDFVTNRSIEQVQLEILKKKISEIKGVLEPAAVYTKEDIQHMLDICP